MVRIQSKFKASGMTSNLQIHQSDCINKYIITGKVRVFPWLYNMSEHICFKWYHYHVHLNETLRDTVEQQEVLPSISDGKI